MSKFHRKFSFVFVCNLIALVSVSCPLDPTPINYQRWGVSISKYEKWMTPKVEDLEAKGHSAKLYLDSLYGYSDWMDWKSADGDRLRPYIDVNEIPNDFSGKFRVLAYQQKFLVGFNDENFTTVSFYNYCGLTDEVLEREDGKTFRGKLLTKVTDDIYMYAANFIKYTDRKPLYYFETHKKVRMQHLCLLKGSLIVILIFIIRLKWETRMCLMEYFIVLLHQQSLWVIRLNGFL